MAKEMNTKKLGWHSLGTSFACACGMTHSLPIEACHIGDDAAARLALFAQDRCGASCLVVSDENTREVGGEAVLSALSARGKRCMEKTYGASPIDATDALGDEVAAAGRDADFYVAIGSGSVCDLAKYAGHQQGKPVLLFATAASMNGYTSAIVAMKVRGLKRTLPCAPAIGVFADPAVVATAPARMTAAGVGDFLSKCSSSSDWRAAHILRGGYYCERPREFFEGTQEKLLAAAPRVGRGDTDAIAVVFEALLLSGLSMVVAGSSAPASGGEHLISHYLDMKHALYGAANDLHGIQVGVATVYCLKLWEKALAIDPAKLDVDALIAAQPAEDEIHEWIREDWGAVGAEVQAQWSEKAIGGAALRAELERYCAGLSELREALQRDLLPSAVVAKAIRDAGGPTEPEQMNASVDEYYKALKRARFLRNRFTILDLAAELGVT